MKLSCTPWMPCTEYSLCRVLQVGYTVGLQKASRVLEVTYGEPFVLNKYLYRSPNPIGLQLGKL
jgi:hypothetical protein